jgi:hypothetical protein
LSNGLVMTVPPTVKPPELSKRIGFLFGAGDSALAKRGENSRIVNMLMAAFRDAEDPILIGIYIVAENRF